MLCPQYLKPRPKPDGPTSGVRRSPAARVSLVQVDIEGILDAAKVVALGRRFREAEAGHLDVPPDLASIVARPGQIERPAGA